MNVDFRFSSLKIQDFVLDPSRNILIMGGFNSGKTWGAIQKAHALCLKFPGYRWAICRANATELRRTTQQTFYKVVDRKFFSSPPEGLGGKEILGNPSYVDYFNGSRIYWLHLEDNESSLKSLELNGIIIDQAEEVEERIFDIADLRIGRWDQVQVPKDLLQQFPDWPRSPFTGNPLAPTYNILLANPPDEGEFSYLYTKFHPDSEDKVPGYKYYEVSTDDNLANPVAEEQKKIYESKDQEWQEKYRYGRIAKGEGAIHRVSPLSILVDPPYEWYEELLRKSSLSRILDHGDSSPTCCLWSAAHSGIYVFYREYYRPNALISDHRIAINELSGKEYYNTELADPSIFRKQGSREGAFWTVADEYLDDNIKAPPIVWAPADNNEFATRNRINELLQIDPSIRHPITNEFGAPRLYFIKRTEQYLQGCQFAIRQLGIQKRKYLDTVNGKKFYSDDRDETVADHAYDCIRYYCASHEVFPRESERKYHPRSWEKVKQRIEAMRLAGRIR